MSIEEEYRKNGADSLDLATKQANSTDKTRLLLMAAAWLDLADRLARRLNKRQALMEHTLVERVFGQEDRNLE